MLTRLFKNGTTNRKREREYEEGRGKGWELTLCLRIDSYGAWVGDDQTLSSVVQLVIRAVIPKPSDLPQQQA
jgi:hypothetical protein